MEKTLQLKEETSYFVEALRTLLEVQERVYEGFTSTYGEEPGDKAFNDSPAQTALETAKREISLLIGLSLELDWSGALSKPETAKEGGVC